MDLALDETRKPVVMELELIERICSSGTTRGGWSVSSTAWRPRFEELRRSFRPSGSSGTWDAGPFDNDIAADFAIDLDEAAIEVCETLIRSVLKRAANPADCLDAFSATRAVAATALVVAQCPGGEPTCPNCGPSEPMPEFLVDLRMPAIDAVDQVSRSRPEPGMGSDEQPAGSLYWTVLSADLLGLNSWGRSS